MKMHLVVAAALAALSSHAAFAASEGGDTWSELQPVAGSTLSLTTTTAPSFSSPQRAFPIAASEGGDTWSALESGLSKASPTESIKVATTAPLSTLRQEEPSVYGTPAQADSADRIVRMEPDSHWINVAYGETVNFVANGENGSEHSFVWRFDVSPAVSHVDLSEVAPADFPDRNLRVFVAEDPKYTGD